MAPGGVSTPGEVAGGVRAKVSILLKSMCWDEVKGGYTPRIALFSKSCTITIILVSSPYT